MLMIRPCGAEMRQGFARNEKGAAGVGFEDGVPLVEGKALEGRGAKDGGVVDEDVEAAKSGDGLNDGCADGGFGAHIAGNGEGIAAESGDVGGGLGGVRSARRGR
jgi:hypothetical protein